MGRLGWARVRAPGRRPPRRAGRAGRNPLPPPRRPPRPVRPRSSRRPRRAPPLRRAPRRPRRLRSVRGPKAPAIDRYLATLEHDELLVRRGERSGLFTIAAVHSTARGPALGGCRMWGYDDSRAAVRDALRLSRGMTYKSAVAGLPLGGGKGVIMLPPDGAALEPRRRRAVLHDFADTVEALRGRYVTAEDVGTSTRDMQAIAEVTRHVTGLPRR